MSLEETARGLIDAMQPRGGTEPYDTPATVLRVEGGTLWVHIPGGAEETPVQKTINASPGDTIQIRVGGGTAWAVGNATAPPTDDTVATAAAAQATEAEKVANGVKTSLEMQEGMIRAAVETADEASQAASEAVQKLDSITFRVIGSDGTVTEIEINDQGQINLLGTVLAQKIMAEDIVATGSFQIDNDNFSLTAANYSINLQAKTNLGSVTVGGIYCGNGTPKIGGNAIVAAIHKTVEGTTTANGAIALNIPVNQYGILCVWRVDDTSVCTPYYPTAYSGWWAKVTTSGANPAPVANTSVILEVDYYYRIAVKPM